jgi:hypothetical protein
MMAKEQIPPGKISNNAEKKLKMSGLEEGIYQS